MNLMVHLKSHRDLCGSFSVKTIMRMLGPAMLLAALTCLSLLRPITTTSSFCAFPGSASGNISCAPLGAAFAPAMVSVTIA